MLFVRILRAARNRDALPWPNKMQEADIVASVQSLAPLTLALLPINSVVRKQLPLPLCVLAIPWTSLIVKCFFSRIGQDHIYVHTHYM
jgi:hypothetical protein